MYCVRSLLLGLQIPRGPNLFRAAEAFRSTHRDPPARADTAVPQSCASRRRAGPSRSNRAAQTAAQIIFQTRCRTFPPARNFRSNIAPADRSPGSRAIPPLLAQAVRSALQGESGLLAVLPLRPAIQSAPVFRDRTRWNVAPHRDHGLPWPSKKSVLPELRFASILPRSE